MSYEQITIPEGTIFYHKNSQYKTKVPVLARVVKKKVKKDSEYIINAREALKKMGITFEAVFLKNEFHFETDKADKQKRDIYKIKLRRGKAELSVDFGQSLANSKGGILEKHYDKTTKEPYYTTNKGTAPTEYDLLSCLTKYNPGIFEDYCKEYGYDPDSRRAEKDYNSVVKEWLKVSHFFSYEELEIIKEIE
jgi:hypothetical protein